MKLYIGNVSNIGVIYPRHDIKQERMITHISCYSQGTTQYKKNTIESISCCINYFILGAGRVVLQKLHFPAAVTAGLCAVQEGGGVALERGWGSR